jgi:hypothetical protein
MKVCASYSIYLSPKIRILNTLIYYIKIETKDSGVESANSAIESSIGSAYGCHLGRGVVSPRYYNPAEHLHFFRKRRLGSIF